MRTLPSLPASLGRALAVSLLAVGAAAPAFAVDPLVRFDGGIGSQPLRAATNNPDESQANRVFNTQPGGAPWLIRDLDAVVRVDGSVQVQGEGLILAGGNSIGTPGATERVRARLFCDGIAHTTASAPLAADGGFRIGGFLMPTPPSPCNNPVLLILNDAGATPAADRWFAAGIPKAQAPKPR